MNHARRLADGDWAGSDSDGEEDMEKQEEGKREQDVSAEEEGMEIERRKLPKHYANQVRPVLDMLLMFEGANIFCSLFQHFDQ